MATPTAAYQDLQQYGQASGEGSTFATAETYLENASSAATKAISNHKLVEEISLALAVLIGIGTYYYLKDKKAKK